MNQEFEKMGLKDGDILLVKGLTTIEELKRLQEHLKNSLKLNKILILNCSKNFTIETLPEEEMNKHGWYRKEDE